MLSNLRIRPLTIDDEAFLWNALYHAIHVPPGATAPAPETVKRPELSRYVINWMQRPDDVGFLVAENGKPIGAAWLRRWSGSEQGYGFVNVETPELTMALLPEHRGRGIGTMLLRQLLSVAQERFAAVSLSVSETNRVRRLYEREGFVYVGIPKDGSLTMVRRFAP